MTQRQELHRVAQPDIRRLAEALYIRWSAGSPDLDRVASDSIRAAETFVRVWSDQTQSMRKAL